MRYTKGGVKITRPPRKTQKRHWMENLPAPEEAPSTTVQARGDLEKHPAESVRVEGTQLKCLRCGRAVQRIVANRNAATYGKVASTNVRKFWAAKCYGGTGSGVAGTRLSATAAQDVKWSLRKGKALAEVERWGRKHGCGLLWGGERYGIVPRIIDMDGR